MSTVIFSKLWITLSKQTFLLWKTLRLRELPLKKPHFSVDNYSTTGIVDNIYSLISCGKLKKKQKIVDKFRKNAKEKHKKTPFYPQTFVLFHKAESYPHLYTIEYLYRKTNRTTPLFLFLFCRKKYTYQNSPNFGMRMVFLQYNLQALLLFISSLSRQDCSTKIVKVEFAKSTVF